MDRGAWWATVHGVRKSRSLLGDSMNTPVAVFNQQAALFEPRRSAPIPALQTACLLAESCIQHLLEPSVSQGDASCCYSFHRWETGSEPRAHNHGDRLGSACGHASGDLPQALEGCKGARTKSDCLVLWLQTVLVSTRPLGWDPTDFPHQRFCPGSSDENESLSVVFDSLTLCNPMDCTVHGVLQARILERVAIPFSRGSSQHRDRT